MTDSASSLTARLVRQTLVVAYYNTRLRREAARLEALRTLALHAGNEADAVDVGVVPDEGSTALLADRRTRGEA